MPKPSLKNNSSYTISFITGDIMGERFYTFPQGISAKVNVIAWLELELTSFVQSRTSAIIPM